MIKRLLIQTEDKVKPVAYYKTAVKTPYPGERAFLMGVTGHHNPDIKGDSVITSPVLKVGALGEFETVNTIYRPEKPLNDDDD